MKALREAISTPVKNTLRPIRDRIVRPALNLVSDLISMRSYTRWQYRRHGLELHARRAYQFLNAARDVYPYQPFYGVGSSFIVNHKAAVRPCADRWNAFQPHLPSSGSALDVGCQNGFFTFSMAALNLVTVGVERDETSVRICQLLALANPPLPAAFLNMDISDETVETLPHVDVTLCLSIFHNWVRDLGFDRADRIMRSLAARTGNIMIFETGQNTQTDADWAKHLAFMGSDPKAWIANYLKDIGFQFVESIGTFEGTTKHASTRHLFVALKKPA